MSDLNNLSLMGRVVRDAEMKVTASGVKVTVFSVATNRTRKDESGNYTDEGHFFPLAVYGNYAKKMLPRLKKGQRVVIEGFVRQDRWVTGDGQKRSAMGIGVRQIHLIFDTRKTAEGKQDAADAEQSAEAFEFSDEQLQEIYDENQDGLFDSESVDADGAIF